MSMKKLQRASKASLENEGIKEGTIRDWIGDNPDVLDLGPVIDNAVKEQVLGRGRVDLVLESSDSHYVTEIQRGKLDADHVTRILEYWDLYRRQKPDTKCIAVLIAEDVTSRFLNVISLFNTHIPIVVIQMEALRINDSSDVYLNFVTVMHLQGRDDESDPGNRGYWEDRAEQTMPIANTFIDIAREVETSIEPDYLKSFISLRCDGKSRSFLRLKPQVKKLLVEVNTPECEATRKLADAGMDVKGINTQGWFGVALTKEDVEGSRDPIKDLIREAHSLAR